LLFNFLKLKINTKDIYEVLFNQVNNSFTNENPVLIKILTDILKRLFLIGNK